MLGSISGVAVTTVGTSEGADWRLEETTLITPDEERLPLSLQLSGRHNYNNASLAVAALAATGIDPAEAAQALSTFTGVGRRFECKGQAGGVTVIDDYAHHPREIAATLEAARARFPDQRIWAVFQPHTYSRTKALLPDFAAALDGADRVALLDIYPARETDDLGVSADSIAALMRQPALPAGKPATAAKLLAEEVEEGDVVFTIGAGDVTLVGPALLSMLRARGT